METIEARQLRLDRAIRRLRRGALANIAVALLLLLLGITAGIQASNDLLRVLQQSLMPAYVGSAAEALLLLILISMGNVSAFLVLIIAVQAHESWAIPGIILLMLANGLLLIVVGTLTTLLGIAFGALALVPLLGKRGVLRSNPVMVRELRGRMRGARAFVVLTLYLALMGGFSLILYFIFGAVNAQNASSATGIIGRTLFTGVVGIQLLLIILIAPSFTAGAITGERERQTYDLVRTTLLSAPSFIMGKLESSLAYILLLLMAAVPLQALAFLFGGIGQAELLLAFIILAVTAVAFGAVGIYFSASQLRTLSASVRTYAVIGIGAFLVPLVLLFVINLLLGSNLVMGGASGARLIESVLQYVRLVVTSLNPFTTALDTQTLLVEQQVWGVYARTLSSDGSTIPMISAWIPFSIVYVAAAALLVVVTVRATRSTDHEA